jgi:hypothetical protein
MWGTCVAKILQRLQMLAEVLLFLLDSGSFPHIILDELAPVRRPRC